MEAAVYSDQILIRHFPCSGGEEVLLDVGGQDATEAFEDVGHSDEAREILEGLLVGNLKRVVSRPTFATWCILFWCRAQPWFKAFWWNLELDLYPSSCSLHVSILVKPVVTVQIL